MSLREDVRELDRRAVEASTELVSRVSPSDLDRPTPCADWDLRALIHHMAVQHHGFAVAAAGGGADPRAWAPGQPPADPRPGYREAAGEVLAAFAAPDVLARPFTLPEISAGAEFPGQVAISFHFVDYVVHSWDVARSLGVEVGFDQAVLAAALAVAGRVPDGEPRLRPGAAFAPSLPAPADTPPLDRIVSLLGRSPSWPR